MKNILAATLAVAFVAGCASRSENIASAYVSPTLYSNLSCGQLREEATMVSSRAIAASGAQDKKAGNDAAVMAVGMIVFWPALLFTQGDGAQAAEVARLKGEMEAIETASRRNGCGIVFNKTPPKKAAPASNSPHARPS